MQRGRGASAAIVVRGRSGKGVLNFIIAVGVLVFVLLFLISFGLKGALKNLRGGADAALPFDGARAYADLAHICAIGPRPPGSPGAEQVRAVIREEVSRAGLRVIEQPFEAETPYGPKKMVNVVGVVEGSRDGVIVLGNHYDTKYLPEIRFVGANDGGSTTAWMIEMARVLGPRREGRSIWLVWFDGEEAFKTWSESDSLYGSREFVRRLEAEGKTSQVHAMVNVDMIGDRYLGILRDAEAPGWLVNTIWAGAAELGLGGYFLNRSQAIEDDHVPFRRAGIPAINLIDYEYGGSTLDHKNNWHTANDTVDRVSPESLEVVGKVVFRAIPGVEAYLDSLDR